MCPCKEKKANVVDYDRFETNEKFNLKSIEKYSLKYRKNYKILIPKLRMIAKNDKAIKS